MIAGVGQQTARRRLQALKSGFLAITLARHRAHFRKRLLKQARPHFLDTRVICYLLGTAARETEFPKKPLSRVSMSRVFVYRSAAIGITRHEVVSEILVL